MKNAESIEVGRRYSEEEVKREFGIAADSSPVVVVGTNGTEKAWLAVTGDLQDRASMHGFELSVSFAAGELDETVLSRLETAELHVFFRTRRRDPFWYCGWAEYLFRKNLPRGAVEIRLRLLESRADEKGELRVIDQHEAVAQDVQFVADVHLVRILGEQLIASEKVGILELIKNAYDAGAEFCRVRIDNVPGLPDLGETGIFEPPDRAILGLPGPVITIRDNGRGMDYPTLVNGWLRPATTIKTNLKERLKREREQAEARGTLAVYEQMLSTIRSANAGRLPLGEKGVGRFAAHRLGTHLVLNTKTASDPQEWRLEIDWNLFENMSSAVVDLSSVPVRVVHQRPEIDYGLERCGTRLLIYGERQGFAWDLATLRDIGQSVAGLRSPVNAPKGFQPEFICPQLNEQFEAPTRTVNAPFHCTAIVDEGGKADIEVTFTPPVSLTLPMAPQSWTEDEDLRRSDVEYWRLRQSDKRLKRPRCGPLLVDIKCWIRRNQWVDAPDFKGFTSYLDQFGGIGVYRDGLAVLPAQDGARRDWLNLEKQIIKSGANISYYNMAGVVEISGEKNPELIDQTSRQGMIEAEPYRDLTYLVRAVVDRLNLRVKEVRDQEDRLKLGASLPRSTLNKRVRITGQVLDQLASNYDFNRDAAQIKSVFALEESSADESPKSIVAGLKRASNELLDEIARLEEEANALLETAGYAISVSVSLHEIEKITGNLVHGLNIIRKSATPNTEVSRRAERMKGVAESLLNELKRLAPLRVSRIEQKAEFSVRDAILAATGVFLHAWADEDIDCIVPEKMADFKAYGSFGGCSQIFANLMDNATYWLRAREEPQGKIGVFVFPDRRSVLVADTGPGIAASIQEHLFKPFYSLKSPPSGLGLYICRYYMRQFKGDIRLAKEDERDAAYPGAQFIVKFPPAKE